MASSKSIKYIPAIDHLRAYAAILISFYHSVQLISRKALAAKHSDQWSVASDPIMALIHEGHTAVGLFIVLRGFIFTNGSLGKRIIYSQFLYNRILRIYPLMITMTFISVSVFPERFSISNLICTLLPFQNTAVALQLGRYTCIFWTIAVEFQFYLIFPFLHRFLADRGFKILLLIGAMTILTRVSALLHSGNPREFSYWTILGRLDQFVLGMLAAVLTKHYTLEDQRLHWALPCDLISLFGSLFLFKRREDGW